MLKISTFRYLIITIAIISSTQAQNSQNPQSTLLNINNFSYWIDSDAWAGRNPNTLSVGGVYPRSTAGVIFQDGIFWGGRIKDGLSSETQWGDYDVRVGGTNWHKGLQRGAILEKGAAEDTLDTDVRIWRIRRDWQTADLKEDAAEFFNVPQEAVTSELIMLLRNQYERDWNEWPWQKGAPFYDDNNNGIMDQNEEPGLAYADQVIWLIANDLDSARSVNFYGSKPIGVELQQTLWAYKNRGMQGNEPLDNVIFKRFRLIYKGVKATPNTATIDSMHFGIWADPDLGYLADDYIAADTSLDLTYIYNSSSRDQEFLRFSLAPPAVGYALLQGPLVQNGNPSDLGFFDFSAKRGYRNLRLKANFITGAGSQDSDPTSGGDYRGTLQIWNVLNGFRPRPEVPRTPFIDATTGEVTKFRLTGDPIKGTGYLDSNPGGRRFMVSTGPFQMALGDTQEVIVAIVGGLGSDRFSSISVMNYNNGYARLAADENFELGFLETGTKSTEPKIPQAFQLYQNFPNPFNPNTQISFDVPGELHINLTIYNLLGQKIVTLIDQTRPAGNYTVSWGGKDKFGREVAGGLYFYQMTIGRFSETKKMLLVR